MRILKLTLQYEGTAYVGWQRQAEGTSVQGLVEDALARLDGRAVTLIGAGRTDAGVHAVGQVASAEVENTLEPPAILRALNATLPADLRVIHVAEAPPRFHARYDARGKHYRYRILNGEVATPFECRYAWHVRQRLDEDAMSAAATVLVGRHDFVAFRAAGAAPRRSRGASTVATRDAPSTARTVTLAHFSRESLHAPGPGPLLCFPETTGILLAFDIAADGFLRHMVRAIVGTLVEIGSGRLDAADLGRVLESRDRGQAGPTAPPQGLFLMKVEYDAVSQHPVV